jgi:hypothetical protein
MWKSIILIFALLSILVGCQGETGPDEVVSSSTKAFNDGNFEELIGYYADDAEVKFTIAIPRDSKNTYKGSEELLGMFEEMAERHTSKEVDIQNIDTVRVIANAKISDDFTREQGIDPLEYEEVYTFQDDKIRWVDSTISHDSVVNYMRTVPFELASIFGKWSIEDDSGFAQFNGDNTYRFGSRLSDLDTGSGDSGSYKFEGSLVTFTSDENSNTCQSGDVGTHLFKVLEDGRLQVIMLEDQCDYRRSYVVELTKIADDS